jgi:NAD(P)-dependent dehydrogenase (short-subunit alcohol dehydrogenase family)
MPTALLLNASSATGRALTFHLLSQSYHVVTSYSNVSLGHTLAATSGPNTIFFPSDLSSWSSTVSLFEKASNWAAKNHKATSPDAISCGIDALFILPPESASSVPSGEALLGELLAPNLRWENDEMQLQTGLPEEPDVEGVMEATKQMLWGIKAFAQDQERGRRVGRVVVVADGAELSAAAGMPVYGASTHAVCFLSSLI